MLMRAVTWSSSASTCEEFGVARAINVGQIAAVRTAFRFAGYEGPLRVVPVASEDERLFVLPSDVIPRLTDLRGLEQLLQQILGRKVWILDVSQIPGPTEDFD
jgi:hypothetical protein